MIPIKAKTGVNEDGFRRLINRLELCIPVRDRSQLVIVVPMFAPIMIPVTWLNDMIPELTKPTDITVTADED